MMPKLVSSLSMSLVLVSSALLFGVAPAGATPVDVFFNGPSVGSNAFGISLASAIDARDNFGVPILTPSQPLSVLGGRLSVELPPSSSLVLNPTRPTSTNNTAISNWQIENTSGSVLSGASFLLFTHATPYGVGSTTIEYDDANVGLRIDAEDGWVIMRGQTQGVDYYYPALLLDRTAANPDEGNLSAGERVTAAIHYIVNEPMTGIRNNGRTNYYLPQLQLGFAQAVVIPEPGTALLLGFGLTVLAARRKRA